MKTYSFCDPNSSMVITISDETEQDARAQIAEICSGDLVNTLRLEDEEDEDDDY